MFVDKTDFSQQKKRIYSRLFIVFNKFLINEKNYIFQEKET